MDLKLVKYLTKNPLVKIPYNKFLKIFLVEISVVELSVKKANTNIDIVQENKKIFLYNLSFATKLACN